MKEACSTRVPEDSYPPPSSPGSRKLPAAFPGAFLPILPRSRFFRRHQEGFFFPFFLPPSPRGSGRNAPGAELCPARLCQEGKPGEAKGWVQRRREGSELRGPSPAQEVCARTKLWRRCRGCRYLGTPGAAAELCSRRWGEALPGPSPQKHSGKEGREGPHPYALPAMQTALKHSLKLVFVLAQKVTIIIVKRHEQTEGAETYSNLKFFLAGQARNVRDFGSPGAFKR